MLEKIGGTERFVHADPIVRIGFDVTRGAIWSCDRRGWILWWHPASGQLAHSLDARRPVPCTEVVFAALITPDGERAVLIWGDGLVVTRATTRRKLLWARQIDLGNWVELSLTKSGKHARVATEWPSPHASTFALANGKESRRARTTHAIRDDAEAKYPHTIQRAGRTFVADGQRVRVHPALTTRSESSPYAPAVEVIAIAGDDASAFTSGESSDGLITVWDVGAARRQGALTGLDDKVRFLRVTPDGRHVVGTSWGYRRPPRLVVWDAATGKAMWQSTARSWGWHALAMAPHASYLLMTVTGHVASGDRSTFVGVVDLANRRWSWRRMLPRAFGSRLVGAFSPRGDRVVLHSEVGDQACSADAATGEDERPLVHPARVTIEAMLPGVVLGRSRETEDIVAWSPPEGRARCVVPSSRRDVQWVAAASVRGTRVAVARGSEVFVWDRRTGITRDTVDLSRRFDRPTSLVFANDSPTLLVGTARGLVLKLKARTH